MKKLEKTCFGLTLSIIRFHLKECYMIMQTCIAFAHLYNNLTEQLFKMKPDDGQC